MSAKMNYTLLDTSLLSPEAQRVLGSGASKMMAARGMAPLADPKDLITVLYQLCHDPDKKLSTSAQKSAHVLPLNILEGGLSAKGLNEQVIDYFVHHADCGDELIETVILNQETADFTIAQLAKTATQEQVDLIATNEARLLGYPDIVASLYLNSKARMSTIDRIVELAIRNSIEVVGISTWDEVCRAFLDEDKNEEEKPSAQEMDAMFESVAGVDDDEIVMETMEEEEIQLRDMTIPMKIRLATIGNKFQRSQLIKDPKKMVSMAVIKSPMVKENEALTFASNNSISEDVIAYIATRKDWTKQYQFKKSLILNPKCPLAAAIRFLPHLRRKDIDALARSRNIPSALSSQAKRLKAARNKKS